MTPASLIKKTRELGVTIRVVNDKIRIEPASQVPQEIIDAIRQQRSAIIDLLIAEKNKLPPDQLPWLHVARQVLDGEFEGGHRSLSESLIIGLRSINHPTCRTALARLQQAQHD